MTINKILLVCGTSETTILAQAIKDKGFSVIVSTATDAFIELDDINDNSIERHQWRLDCNGFVELIKNELVLAIVNACHPYAAELRSTINEASLKTGVPCFNYVRPIQSTFDHGICQFAANHENAAEAAFTSKRPVLLTIGSKNINFYLNHARKTGVPVIARVLPRIESLAACADAGLLDHEIIAGRGPFTIEENIAVIKRYNIGVVVTKNSGKEGGFQEKIIAAQKCHCTIIIVDRPELPEMPNSYSDISNLLNCLTLKVVINDTKSVTTQILKVHDPLHDYNVHGGNLRKIAEECHFSINQIFDFSANINPCGPVPNLKKVLETTYNDIIRYPDPDYVLLKNAIHKFGGWNTDMIIPANGASELLYATAAHFREKRALIPVPSYSDYSAASERAAMKISHFKLPEENSFKLDIKTFSEHIDTHDIVFIGRPNNPTGYCIDCSLLRQMICGFPNTFFIIDESFIEFSTDISSIAENIPENCVMIRSMTKFYALPGLRLGFAVAHPHIATAIQKQLTPWGINCFSQAAGIESLNNTKYQEESRSMMNYLRSDFIASLLSFDFLKIFSSNANFLLIKSTGKANASLLKEFFLQYGMAVRDCSNFYGLDSNFFRVAIRSKNENDHFINILRKIQIEHQL